MAVRQTPSRIWTVVQARTGSTRLPGKVLKPLGSWLTVMDSVMHRCDQIGYPVCVAMPRRDNPLADLCIRRGWLYVEGSEKDVLGRYAETARVCDADHIIRVTSDCPFLDVEAARWTVDVHLETGADFTHHVAEGRGVEVFSRAALFRADKDACTGWEREHPDEHILARPDRFRIVTAKFSIDTLEDLELARRRANWQ